MRLWGHQKKKWGRKRKKGKNEKKSETETYLHAEFKHGSKASMVYLQRFYLY
jgi:hypothetical protein